MIYISASRSRLQKFAQEILDACDTTGGIDLTIDAVRNLSSLPATEICINNDDMENRDDLPANTIIVDVS